MSSARTPLYVAEPSAQYLARPPLVVDCSAVAGLVFQEDWRDDAAQQMMGRSLHAPYLLQVELASVAVKKLRRGEQHAADGLAEAKNLLIELHALQPQAVADLAMHYKLSAYDAAYLWLAAELKAPLATFDKKLADAARTHLTSLP